MAMFHSRKKLLRAIREGDEALVREHLANAARLEEFLGPLNEDGYTALHAAIEQRRAGLITLLLDHGADVNARTRAGRTPLMLAAKHSNTDQADLLLARHADPKAVDNEGLSVFGHAVYHQRTEVARLLLDHGAEVNDGKSFMRACANRDLRTIALMIERGADAKTASDTYNYQPVHSMAQNGFTEGFNLLHAAQAITNIDARANSGNTALHLAAINGHLGMVEVLLAAGARCDLENNEGLTAEAAALKKDNRPIAKAIRSAMDSRPAEKPSPQAQGQEHAALQIQTQDNVAADEIWVLAGLHSVAQVQTIAFLNRRITSVFNFESRDRLIISENLKTGTEVTLPPQAFDDIGSAAIETAERELKRQGGTVNDNLPGKPAVRKTAP